MHHKPLALIILDGWGYRKDSKRNAIAQAQTPFFDYLMKTYPHTLLNASEGFVGLPKGQIGNSEVGHMTMGSGRIIDLDLVRINKAIAAGEFISNPAFTQLFDHVKKYHATLHILGLVSPGGIHSHRDHLYAFLKTAKAAGLKKVVIHAFTDGRDVPPKSAAHYLHELEDVIEELGIGFIATVQGRFFAMDRDKNWDRLQKAEAAIFKCRGNVCRAKRPSVALQELYHKGIIDELLEPLVFLDDSGQGYPLEKNDGVFFFNFRADRARQLTKKILEKKSSHNICLVTLTEYDKTFDTLVAFPNKNANDCLAAVLSKAGLKQAHIAETEKYAHVTYFFNGGREEPHQNERHILIDSRRDVATHDLAPEMRAKEIADAAVGRIQAGDDFLVINFANADMVGHTANLPAIITAVETVDEQLKRITEAVLAKQGIAVITADHGNAELNIDPQTGEKHTAHTLNLVPFILVSDDKNLKSEIINLKSNGTLADVAPTILELLQLKTPASMTGQSLMAKI